MNTQPVRSWRHRTVLVVLGTRPEAIKLAPVITELRRHSDVTTRVCVTGQHREMLQTILELFDVRPDIDLALMTPDQRLSSLTAAALMRLEEVIDSTAPDWMVLQGDTTSAMSAALAAFYRHLPVAHVEAGLRTHDLARPFPEEANRRIADALATVHFAPTELARQNLLREGADESTIYVTGNTVVDALLTVGRLSENGSGGPLAWLPPNRRIVLLTAHRRESFGHGLRDICVAVREIADALPDVQCVYPVHLNPHVQEAARSILTGHERISLLPPLDYVSLVRLIRRSTLILTDSGGIQEEAPTFGKPVLVLREVTERPEAVRAGCARIVGTDSRVIASAALELLSDHSAYDRMAKIANPFGDGHASERIVRVLRGWPIPDASPRDANSAARSQVTDAFSAGRIATAIEQPEMGD
ncbi:MAG TPA: UDP-N-acetylglucosamine 2-epimerase (non-hydrolyzing) [Candidatus Angelobacter sp.]|nr:UDP-N-acetylglucosamine 2-epimerase (non-hydrolyzing) [Candidatus Angelobacter sp.]